jgi:hypothetical protein
MEPLLCASRGATLEGPFGFPGVSPRGLYGPTPAAPMFFTERLHISHVRVSGSFPVCYGVGNASGLRGADVSIVYRSPVEERLNRLIAPIPHQSWTGLSGLRGPPGTTWSGDASHVRRGKDAILAGRPGPEPAASLMERPGARTGHTRCHLPVTVIRQGLVHTGQTAVACKRAGKRLPARRTRHRRWVCRTGRSRLWTRNRR